MDILLVLTIGCYVGSVAVTLIIWKSPLSWRFTKSEFSVPEEVSELFETQHYIPNAHFSTASKAQQVEIPSAIVPVAGVEGHEVRSCVCGLSFNESKFLKEHLDVSGHGRLKEEDDHIHKSAFTITIGDSPVLCVTCGKPIQGLKRVTENLDIRHSAHSNTGAAIA